VTSTRNDARSIQTRAALVRAARGLFAEAGYADTSTPSIVKAAKVSRGALYHHFQDKADLFRAVVELEQEAVAKAIEETREDGIDPVESLIASGTTFLEAMRDPGRRRILMIDGPAVLGVDTMREIDARHGVRTLAEGIERAIESGWMRQVPAAAVASLLGAAFDRAAELQGDDGDFRVALWSLIDGLRAEPRPQGT
jgi:AcrR family transcriptional regulator